MSVQVTVWGALKDKLDSLGNAMHKAAADGVFITAQDVRTTAVKSIQEQSMGIWVTRSRQGGGTYTHVASAPGNAPNTDTGKLASSIAVEKTGKTEYEIGTNLDYGEHLELGTKFMLPRPWLYPALNFHRDDLLANIEKSADLYIKKLTK